MDGPRSRDGPAKPARCRGVRFGPLSPASDQPPSSSEMAYYYGSPSSDYPQFCLEADAGLNTSPVGGGSRRNAASSRPSEDGVTPGQSSAFRGRVHIELRPDGGLRRSFLLGLLFGDQPLDVPVGGTGLNEQLQHPPSSNGRQQL